MTSKEFSDKCSSIVKAVDGWYAEQDELTRAFHCIAVDVIQMSECAYMETFLIEFEWKYPWLWKRYGKRDIKRKASVFLKSEFEALSPLFCRFYEEFNTRYFDGCLPPYRVTVKHDIPISDYPKPNEHLISSIDRCGAQLSLVYNGWPEEMLAWLINLMAHLRTGVERDTEWLSELARLSNAGAPTGDEVERLRLEQGGSPAQERAPAEGASPNLLGR